MSGYSNCRIEPPVDSWGQWIRIRELDNARLDELRRSARQRLIQSAQQYLLKLNHLSDEAELQENRQPILTGDPDQQPIVMTGHQPVIFHAGLTWKYHTTEQAAAEANAIAVAISIDTDRGDGGQFSYPDVGHPYQPGPRPRFPMGRMIDTLANSHNLFVHGRLRSSSDLARLQETVVRELRFLPEPVSADRAAQVFSEYNRLSAARCTVAEANTIVRTLHGIGGRMLELPLTAVASFPESLALIADVLKQAARFVSVYNSSLKLFREEHGVQNSANPFPDLKVDENRFELPFWVIDHESQRRHVLEVEIDGNVTRLIANEQTIDTFTGSISAAELEPMLLQTIQLVPRGALITAFLRLLFSDLFVHGIGGARYDRFTDEFIRNWWNCEPPPFTLATASRYAFPKHQAELNRLKDLQEQLRELRFNPQRHFGTGIFDKQLENSLTTLTRQKQAAVDSLKSAKSAGRSAADYGKQIQSLTKSIEELVLQAFESDLAWNESLTPEQIDTVNSRTFPWFFFEPADGET